MVFPATSVGGYRSVTIAQLAVCWNGKPLDPFKSSWGLQQGDPLFPYLFVLCMEVFSQGIPKEVEDRRWTPVRVGKPVLVYPISSCR